MQQQPTAIRMYSHVQAERKVKTENKKERFRNAQHIYYMVATNDAYLLFLLLLLRA